MKFKLFKARRRLGANDLAKYEKLGFQFVLDKDNGRYYNKPHAQYDESEYVIPTIEVNTLEELRDRFKEFDCDLIISFENMSITLYDDYIE